MRLGQTALAKPRAKARGLRLRPDQAAIGEIAAVKDGGGNFFVETVRMIPLLFGTGEKEVTGNEAIVREKLRVHVPAAREAQ